MGKAYANRKPVSERHSSDLYETPKSLVWELLKLDLLKDVKTILEPCCGNYAISKELEKAGFNVTSKDLTLGNNFLVDEYNYGDYDAIVTNPAFSVWDDIIIKAKKVSPLVIAIGKTNFFGTQARLNNGVWEHLKDVYIFSRQIDYQLPVQEDGALAVGNLISGWFVWDNSYNDKPRINFIDVQKYCTIGSYENWLKKNDSLKYQQLFSKKIRGKKI